MRISRNTGRPNDIHFITSSITNETIGILIILICAVIQFFKRSYGVITAGYLLDGGDIGRASDLQFTGRGFESWLGTAVSWRWAIHLCTSVIKQYNYLLRAKGQWCSSAGKVTVKKLMTAYQRVYHWDTCGLDWRGEGVGWPANQICLWPFRYGMMPLVTSNSWQIVTVKTAHWCVAVVKSI